jgi:uncharacterized phage protein gp47/JayE
MTLSLQNFTAMVEQMAAAVQGAAAQALDLTVGSTLRSILEANAGLALWLQWLVVQTLQASRLATSTGTDCDSFGADFGFARLPAVPATGTVTFSRFAPILSATIPVGTTVITGDGTQRFTVVADPADAAYSAGAGGYALGAGVGSIDLPVQASAAGTAGNVLPGTVSLLGSSVPGVDTVSNANGFSGGVDAESDDAFRARFGNYLASLTRATPGAVREAVAGVRQGLSVVVSENVDQTGAASPGQFVVTVDDGSGHPSAGLLATVQQAVEAVRPVGTRFAVQGPVVVGADVAMTLTLAAGANAQVAQGQVNAALTAFIGGLPVGATLPYSRLAQIAYDASPSITNVSAVALNNGTADLVPPVFGAVRAGTISVS